MRTVVVATAIGMSVVGLATAEDSQAAIRHTDIPAQPLRPALQQLSKDRGLQLVFRTDVVGDLRTAGAVGDLTVDEALQKLLRGTDLTFQYLDDSTITILPVSSATPAESNAARENETAAPKAGRSFFDRFRLAQATEGTAAVNERGPQGSPESTPRTTQLEEVVVTAQRREENLKDVPISISVLTGDELDRSTASSLTDVLGRVPGVATSGSNLNGATQLSMRGVTASGAMFVGASTVGYYLDSVPFGLARSSFVPDANVYDLERVEVLRGPQGTLYGANSQIGVVRVLTKDPNLDAFEWKARGSTSFTKDGAESFGVDTAINLPLVSDKLAVRAVVGYQDLGGWIDQPTRKDANDGEILTGRFKLKAQPTDELSIDASAWLSRADYGAPSGSPDNRLSPYHDDPIETDYDIFGLSVGYEFSKFTFTSSTSYIDYTSSGAQDFSSIAPGMELETVLDSEVFAQEFNLSSTNDGPWRWSLGGIYRDSDSPELQKFGFFTPIPINFTYRSESFAVFGELTRALMNDRLKLTAGARYFEDHVTLKEIQNFDGAGPLVHTSSDFHKLSPRLVVSWQQNEKLTTYASYAEGFRSGAQQGLLVQLTFPDFPPVDPDNLKNYEIGAKGGFWDGRLAFDAALYFIDWQDVQQPVSVPFSTTAVTAVVNGTSASGLGAEFATTAQLTDALTVGLNFSWNDLTNDADVITFPAATPQTPVVLFPNGSRLNLSPEYTAGVSGDYEFSLGSSGYRGKFSASANYVSTVDSRDLQGSTVTVTATEDLLLGRASFSVESPARWTAVLYVDNIGNEEDAVFRALDPARDTHPRPRTVGLQVEYDFGR